MFSTKAWAVVQNDSSLDSIEAIHDVVHIYSGYGGHMTYVPLSAFDPLFFMHHAMVDRLVAMWQVLNPSAWILPMQNQESSFNAPEGTVQYSGSPLTPFLISQDGTFWDCDLARSTEIFGYAYADTYSSTMTSAQLRQDLIRKIASWYGHTSSLSLMANHNRRSSLSRRIRERRNGARNWEASRPDVRLGAADPPPEAIIKNGRWTEWIANVRVNAGSVGQAFSIHFFFGEPPKGAALFFSAPNHVGSVDFVSASLKKTQSLVSSAIPLTRALRKVVAAGFLPGLDPIAVEPYLKSMLQFRVLPMDNRIIDPKTLDGLAIWVNSAIVKAPESSAELPGWEPEIVRISVWQ